MLSAVAIYKKITSLPTTAATLLNKTSSTSLLRHDRRKQMGHSRSTMYAHLKEMQRHEKKWRNILFLEISKAYSERGGVTVLRLGSEERDAQ